MQRVTAKDGTPIASSNTTTKLTRALLICGVVAGPLYTIVGFIQMFIRPGFDIRRHALSLLSNGDLGWIQVANFEVSGLLVIAGALGMRRVLRGSRGGTWGPLLLGVYGLGLIGAGIFSADPALGFPPGTPEDATAISWHGMLHFLIGGIGFLGLIGSCFVFARRFAVLKQPGWAIYSVATGVIFFAAFLGIASGSQGPVSVAFAVAVVIAWVWISLMAARLMVRLPDIEG
jgi:Protein of unknown function (DUF998)